MKTEFKAGGVGVGVDDKSIRVSVHRCSGDDVEIGEWEELVSSDDVDTMIRRLKIPQNDGSVVKINLYRTVWK